MNYYPHHIGDFNSATRHLTRVERSIYRDLIELYYDREGPLPSDVQRLCRLVIAVSNEEATAVQQVLNEFFTETEQGYAHARCDHEIAKYHGLKEAKSAAGKASAAARAEKKKPTPTPAQAPESAVAPTPVEQPLNECSTNQEPRTKNQNQEEQETCAPSAHADLFARFWALYPKKQDKAKALKAWAKLKVTAELFELIASGLAVQAASHDWLKDGGKFVPMPTTWLNGRRWEDEVKTGGNVHAFPGQSRHTGFAERNYAEGMTRREDGTYAF
jgi:uncharacterized protein YdaU (DUF1376 family)